MKQRVKHKAGDVVAKVMSFLPSPVLANLELAAQLGQGKAWGTSTVRREVAAALQLLPPASSPIVALDVGANVGDWAAAFLELAPSGSLHSFEPSSAAFAQLHHRLGQEPRVHLVRSAVGCAPGRATLWSDEPGSVLGSLEHRRLDHHNLTFEHNEEVDVITVDAYCHEHGIRPSLIKMDVEGRELDVLNGAAATLPGVQVVQFEFGGCNIDSRTFFQDFWYLFRDLGFVVYRVTPRGPRPLGGYSEADECFRTTNFLAARSAINS